MKYFLYFLLLFLNHLSFAQVVVVNEVYNGSTQKTDWVELLVIQNNLDLRGYQMRDFSAGGNPQSPLIFTRNQYWNGIHAGTLIVITGDTSLYIEDTSKNDFIIQLRFKGITDTTYFRGIQFDIAITSDAVHAKNPLPDTSHLHGMAWGTGNAGSLPPPSAYISGQLNTGSSCYFSKPTIMNYSDFGVNANLHKDTSSTRGHPNDSLTNGGNYQYILALRNIIGIKKNYERVSDYRLNQNYPNPFNPSTKFDFDLPERVNVKLAVYDILGREIFVLLNQTLFPGNYSVEWSANELPAGIYFYRIETSKFTDCKKMILLK